MAVKLQQISNLINNLAPKRLAYDWDNVGLQLGDYNQEINKVLVSLDINLEVIEEAIEKEADLIVAHHPFIFKSIPNIRFNTPLGKNIQKLIKADIGIYVAHTNYDIAKGGLNDVLAEKLQLKNIEILQTTMKEGLKKIVVFVPQEAISDLKKVMSKSGAGCIGNYSDSFFEQEGMGSFRPLENTNPYLGEKGKINKIKEYRLETIVPDKDVNKVINKMIKAHPYEEVAYDVYSLDNVARSFGIGRIGYLESRVFLEDVLAMVKDELELDSLRFVGEKDKQIKKVAVCSGSGADFIRTASFQGADLLITGDIKYHEAQLAEELDLALIDAGHYGTEKIMKDAMKSYLEKEIRDNKLNVEVIKSQVNTNPFQII